jgi:outer membrane protein assembly factor BamB
MAPLFLALLVVQPQGELIWSRPDTVGGIYNSVALDDLNHDGHPEIVAVPYYGSYPEPPVTMFCHSGINGSELWTQGDCQGTWGSKGLAIVADVNDDSVRDIVLGTPGGVAPGSSVFLKSGADGTTIWTWCTYTQGPNWGWVYAVRGFRDLTGDGRPEVLAAVGGNSNNRSGTAICFDGQTGETLWTWRVPSDGAQCIAEFVDITGDSVPEVAVGAGGNGLDNHVYLLDGRTGTERWNYDMGNSVWTVARMRDVNNSGVDDVVAGSWDYNVACLEGATGARIWDVPLGGSYVVTDVVPVRDVNADSVDDVVVGSWASSVFVLSGRDGSVIWSEPVGADCWSVDTLSDVSGDGVPEVVVGALNGKTVKVFDGAQHQALWSCSFQERIYDVAGVPDLDGDGGADVMVGLQDHGDEQHHIFAYKGLPSAAVAQPALRVGRWQIVRSGQALAVAGPRDEWFRLALFSLSGRELGTIFEGRLGRERRTFDLPAGRMAAGFIVAVLQSATGSASAKLLNLK